jgi:branched-chain amino acid transport system substrate-binding protein
MRAVEALLLCLLLFCSALAGAAEPPVKIGAIVPLTGDMAVHGEEIRKAMQLAAKLHSATRRKYELIFEDNRLEQRLSATAAQKLVSSDRVDVVLTLWPPAALTALPITEKSGTLHYTISWDPTIASTHKYILSHQAMVTNIVRMTAKHLQRRGFKTFAFLQMEEVGFNLGASHMLRNVSAFGQTMVAHERFLPDEKDFRSLILKVRKQKPDAWVIWSVMPSMDLLIAQLRNIEPHANITGYLDYAQNVTALEGSEYISEMYAEPFFIEQYKKEYGTEPISKGANAYDIYNLVVDAYEALPDERPGAAAVKAWLLTVKDRQGAVGMFSIDKDGNSSYSPVVRSIKNGARVLVGRIH